MRFPATYLLTTSLTLVNAIYPPPLPNLKLAWFDSFTGCQGCTPSPSNWNIALDINTNNEQQTYTTASSNLQLSGGETLQVVPWKSKTGEWTSGRVETKDAFTPPPGKLMRIQAGLRMGDNASKQGVWPAFWMLGDSMRHGTAWPLCGELDIFEQINGAMTGYGTVHCGDINGGVCNEPSGLASQIGIPDNEFHAWSIIIDRTSGNWQTETITWMMDGTVFHQRKSVG